MTQTDDKIRAIEAAARAQKDAIDSATAERIRAERTIEEGQEKAEKIRAEAQK